MHEYIYAPALIQILASEDICFKNYSAVEALLDPWSELHVGRPAGGSCGGVIMVYSPKLEAHRNSELVYSKCSGLGYLKISKDITHNS